MEIVLVVPTVLSRRCGRLLQDVIRLLYELLKELSSSEEEKVSSLTQFRPQIWIPFDY